MNKDKQIKLIEELLSTVNSQAEFDALFDSMKKRGIESLLRAELTEHLGYDKHVKSTHRRENTRNGKSAKTIKTANGEFLIDVPRDRDGSFDPVTVPYRLLPPHGECFHELALGQDIENHGRDTGHQRHDHHQLPHPHLHQP